VLKGMRPSPRAHTARAVRPGSSPRKQPPQPPPSAARPEARARTVGDRGGPQGTETESTSLLARALEHRQNGRWHEAIEDYAQAHALQSARAQLQAAVAAPAAAEAPSAETSFAPSFPPNRTAVWRKSLVPVRFSAAGAGGNRESEDPDEQFLPRSGPEVGSPRHPLGLCGAHTSLTKLVSPRLAERQERAEALVAAQHGALFEAAATNRPSSRSPEQVALLSALLRASCEAFCLVPRKALTQLCQAASYESHRRSNVAVVTEGEVGTHVYIVLEGSLAVQRQPSAVCKQVTTGHLRPGDCFGTLALNREGARVRSTARTLEPCSLLRIDEASIRQTMQHPLLGDAGATLDFLCSLRIAHVLEWHQLLMLALVLQPSSYPAGHNIVQQGSPATSLFFVRSGRCQMYREVKFVNHAGSEYMRRVDVGTLGPREIFGEASVLQHNAVAPQTVEALREVHLLVLPRSQFSAARIAEMTLLLHELKLMAKLHPSDETLRQRHEQEHEWHVERRLLSSQVLEDARLRRDAEARNSGNCHLKAHLPVAYRDSRRKTPVAWRS